MLSKLDYGNILLSDAPDYLIKRMQRVQNVAASYVTKRYTTEAEVLNLNWLPIKERIEYTIAKMAFKSINDSSWPRYIKLSERPQSARNLRSKSVSSVIQCKSKIKNTFEYIASKTFNDLPLKCREVESYQQFCARTKQYLKDRALARTMSHC